MILSALGVCVVCSLLILAVMAVTLLAIFYGEHSLISLLKVVLVAFCFGVLGG